MKKLLWILLLSVICQAQTLKEFKKITKSYFENMAMIESLDGKDKGNLLKKITSEGDTVFVIVGSDGVSIGKFQVQPIAAQDVIKYYPDLWVANLDSMLYWDDNYNGDIAKRYAYLLYKAQYNLKDYELTFIAYNAGIAHVWHYRKSGIMCVKYLIGFEYAKEVMK